MAAVFEDDHPRIEYGIEKPFAVFDRNDAVLIAPDDQGRLVDVLRVFLDAAGVPVARGR